jgi:hypothetical protein
MGQSLKKLWEIKVYDQDNELLTRDFAQSELEPESQAKRMVKGVFSAAWYEVNEVQARVKRSPDQRRLQYWSE